LQNIEDEQITCMNYKSTSKETLIALGFASTCKTLPLIKIFSLEKKKTYKLIHSNLSSSWQLYEICFCSDENFIVSFAKNSGFTRVSIFMVRSENFLSDIQIQGIPKNLKFLLGSKKKLAAILDGVVVILSKIFS
jgi:hypothetical protein